MTDKIYLLNIDQTQVSGQYTIITGSGGGDTSALSGQIVILSGLIDDNLDYINSLSGLVILNGSYLTGYPSVTLTRPTINSGITFNDIIGNTQPNIYAEDNIIYMNISGVPLTSGNAELACEFIRLLEVGVAYPGARGIFTLENRAYRFDSHLGVADASLKASGLICSTDNAYSSSWNGNLEVPTKNAVYDQVQLISGNVNSLSGYVTGLNLSGNTTALSGYVTGQIATLSGNIQGQLNQVSGYLFSGAFLDVSQPPWSLVPCHGPNGTGQAVASGNTAKLNAIFNDRVSGVLATAQTVKFPGYGYCINDTIDIPPKIGICVEGQGQARPYSEVPWLVPGQAAAGGGISSRLVWVGPLDRPMVRNYSLGLRWDNVVLQGKLMIGDAEYQTLLTIAHYSDNDMTGWAVVGMEVANQTSGLAPGKMQCPSFMTMLCRTGLKFGQTIGSDNADESWFGYLHNQYCGVAVATVSTNAQLFTVGHFVPYSCNTGWYISGGGNIDIQHAIAIASGGVLISTEYLDINTPIINIGTLSIDNGFKNGRIIKMNQARPAYFGIGQMFVGNQIPTGHAYPLFEILGNSTLNIKSCFLGHEGMVKASWNVLNANQKPTIFMEKWRTYDTQVASGLINNSGTGTFNFTTRDCFTYLGGIAHTSARIQWADGVRTILATGL